MSVTSVHVGRRGWQEHQVGSQRLDRYSPLKWVSLTVDWPSTSAQHASSVMLPSGGCGETTTVAAAGSSKPANGRATDAAANDTHRGRTRAAAASIAPGRQAGWPRAAPTSSSLGLAPRPAPRARHRTQDRRASPACRRSARPRRGGRGALATGCQLGGPHRYLAGRGRTAVRGCGLSGHGGTLYSRMRRGQPPGPGPKIKPVGTAPATAWRVGTTPRAAGPADRLLQGVRVGSYGCTKFSTAAASR
eukprot:SAG31_NODE_644_length_13275_cov_39.464633_2_plen_247_part_00